jgi:hypothetical protein
VADERWPRTDVLLEHAIAAHAPAAPRERASGDDLTDVSRGARRYFRSSTQ